MRNLTIVLGHLAPHFATDRPVTASLKIAREGCALFFEVDPAHGWIDIDFVGFLREQGVRGRSTIHPVTPGPASGHELLACEAFLRRLHPRLARDLEPLDPVRSES